MNRYFKIDAKILVRLFVLLIASVLFLSCENTSQNNTNQHDGKSREKTAKSTLKPIDLGKKLAIQTQGILGKNLVNAINTLGTQEAVAFCSTQAIPITDSMAVALNAKIKRVSDKKRNPNNGANQAELAYIKEAKLAISKGQKPAPKLSIFESKQIAYYSIVTNQMCMQCHGQPQTEILPKTLTKIKELYPQDKATGYKTNELRGIWVIEMDK